MFRQQSVDVHQFAMVPQADVPRSSFRMQRGLKTTFNAGVLVPVLCEEVLPGDTFNCRMTAFARMATPIFPIMDNLYLESFFFFVPCRILWANWRKFMGEQDNPGDSISFTVPVTTSPAAGYPICTVFDYFGLPTVGQVTAGLTVSHNSLPLRAYNRIYNDWFRDENLENSLVQSTGDGPDPQTDFGLRRRGKRHDYFTGCLPWTQKGGVSVAIPLGTAPVKTLAGLGQSGVAQEMRWAIASTGNAPATDNHIGVARIGGVAPAGSSFLGAAQAQSATLLYPSNLYADLNAATLANINSLRQAFQIQRLLERDARGGTRYGEIVRAHFGVISPDARLQRSEYLGGGMTPVHISPVPQTAQTGLTGGTTPLGSLGGFGTALGHGHGFTQSFSEHGYVIALVNVRADLTYQQGLRRMWSRSTRYDFYWPVFAMLGEQGVLNKEIYVDGSANDAIVFGYQERWAEYRYLPSQITGLFRSTSAGTLDGWHLAQRFTALPVLNSTFIRETPPMQRVLAAGAAADNAEFISDFFFDIKAGRPLPLYSVPGLIDHF